jgi:teichuronic acid biosynthesis glycosyltransferase TuaC
MRPPSDPSSSTGVRPCFLVPHLRAFLHDQVWPLATMEKPALALVRYNPLVRLAQVPGLRRRLSGMRKYSSSSLVPPDPPLGLAVRLLRAVYLRSDGHNPWLGRRLGRKAIPLVRRAGSNLLHAHFVTPFGLAGATVKAELGLPLVITAHGYDVYDAPFRSAEWLAATQEALSAADHVITVSDRNRELLSGKLGVAPSKVTVIPNGFDPAKFHPRDKGVCRRQLGLADGRKVVLCVANLVPIKGHADLLEAFVQVHKETGALLVLVGDGPLRGPLEVQAKRLGLEADVRFVGAVPHDEVPVWMGAADLFVLASHDEGQPTVLSECAGMRLPFVATDVGGTADVRRRTGIGELVPAHAPFQLAAAIARALETTPLEGKAVHELEWPKIAATIHGIHESVLDSGKPYMKIGRGI